MEAVTVVPVRAEVEVIVSVVKMVDQIVILRPFLPSPSFCTSLVTLGPASSQLSSSDWLEDSSTLSSWNSSSCLQLNKTKTTHEKIVYGFCVCICAHVFMIFLGNKVFEMQIYSFYFMPYPRNRKFIIFFIISI